MRILPLASFALIAAGLAAPAAAEDPAAPPSAIIITGGATVVSDYRFRGVSQTDKRFAIQGTFTITHKSGFYVSVWGSSIDDYVANGSNAELDLIAGYSKTIDGTKFDGGVLYYYYPGSHGANTDFFEPYFNVSHTFGPVGAKVGLNYAPKTKAQGCGLPTCKSKEDSLYTYGELSAAIPKTGFTITGHVGESWGRSYLTNGLKNYTDYSITAAYVWKQFTISAAYVDTDFKRREFLIPSGRNPIKGGVVGSVGVAF